MKVAFEQSMMQAITQAAIEAAKATILAVKEEEGPIKSKREIHTAPRLSGSSQKQPTFNWKVVDTCDELIYFEMEVRNIFMMNRL